MNWLFPTSAAVYIISGIIAATTLFSKKISEEKEKVFNNIAFVLFIIGSVMITLSAILFHV